MNLNYWHQVAALIWPFWWLFFLFTILFVGLAFRYRRTRRFRAMLLLAVFSFLPLLYLYIIVVTSK